MLWDSIRKSLDTIEAIVKEHPLSGWRKLRYWYKTVKKAYRRAANIHQKKGKNYQQRLEEATDTYLSYCRKLVVRLQGSILILEATQSASLLLPLLLEELKYYHGMVLKHIDLLDRRILQGEKIPHSDKVFSIFEPHVEW